MALLFTTHNEIKAINQVNLKRTFFSLKLGIIFIALCFVSPLSFALPVIPSPPAISAKGYLLIDFDSQQVIAESNADSRLEPASLTKILTAYIIFQEIQTGNVSLQDLVTVSEKAWRMKGSRTFIEVGKKIPVETLLRGMIVQSGNDATVALAEHIAGSEEVFVTVMNQRAADLGMVSSHFVNTTGLPHPEHFTTARDLATLATAMIRDFPEFYQWYSQKEFTFNGIKQSNRNRLLWQDESVDGLKTGHTDSAGYCLVASAKRENMRLVSVILGTRSETARANETKKLLNYGFRFFETHRLFGPHEPIKQVRIWKGESEELSVGLPYELFITVPRGQAKDVNVSVSLPEIITAPKSQGEELGFVQITLNGELITEHTVISLQNVEEGGMFDRMMDEIKLMFH